MQIELNTQEVDVVMKALKTYENAPQTEGLLVSVMTAVLTGKPPANGETNAARTEANAECNARKMVCIPILAKLIKQDFAAPPQHDPVTTGHMG